MIQKSITAILICLSVTACSHKAATHSPDTADFVASTLGHAAEDVHENLAMLAKLRGQGLQPLLPPSDASLDLPVSIDWTGPADGAVKQVCLQVGYRYRETGKQSAQSMPIVVHGFNRPAHELLEDIAWQIQPQAVLRVDPITRTITLARTSGREDRS